MSSGSSATLIVSSSLSASKLKVVTCPLSSSIATFIIEVSNNVTFVYEFSILTSSPGSTDSGASPNTSTSISTSISPTIGASASQVLLKVFPSSAALTLLAPVPPMYTAASGTANIVTEAFFKYLLIKNASFKFSSSVHSYLSI